MTYLEHINKLLKEEVAKRSVVAFGQNIVSGSCLGGLTRGIEPKKEGLVINSQNAENSLVGVGFGLAMGKANAIFFMKQLDFLLLGIDQLVDTYNIIRSTWDQKELGSFTIFPVTIDNGFQGPQSSFNSFADFCTIAKIRGYTLTNKHDSERIIRKHLISPGFRIITVSQRLMKEPLLEPPAPLFVAHDESVFQYTEGKEVTIVTFNFSFPYGLTLEQKLKEKGISAELWNVNSPSEFNPKPIATSLEKTRKLIIIDDSKSENLPYRSILEESVCSKLEKRIIIKRELGADWLHPVRDQLDIDYEDIIKKLTV